MQFTKFAILGAIASIAQAAAINNSTMKSTVSATVVVESIKNITTVSGQTNTVAKKITSAPSAIQFGPQIISDLTNIVSMGTADVSMLGFTGVTSVSSGPTPYSSSDQNLICGAFVGFVHVHQDLLRTVIGKHGLISSFGFDIGVAGALRGIEHVVDELAFGLIGLVPTCASQAMQAKMQLDGTLKTAVTTYSG